MPERVAGPFYGFSLHVPVVGEQAEKDGAGLCQVCGVLVTRVPGGQGPTWTHPSGAVVGDNFPDPEVFNTALDWGIRYGDDEVGDGYTNREDAEEEIAGIRKSIKDGIYEDEDYEPMTVVCRMRREYVEHVTGWVEG